MQGAARSGVIMLMPPWPSCMPNTLPGFTPVVLLLARFGSLPPVSRAALHCRPFSSKRNHVQHCVKSCLGSSFFSFSWQLVSLYLFGCGSGHSLLGSVVQEMASQELQNGFLVAASAAWKCVDQQTSCCRRNQTSLHDAHCNVVSPSNPQACMLFAALHSSRVKQASHGFPGLFAPVCSSCCVCMSSIQAVV